MTRADLVVASDALAPSRARELLASAVGDPSRSEGIALCELALSEVVSNAVRHGGVDEIRIVIEQADDIVRVTVIQSGSIDVVPSIAEMPEAWATHGYGLGIVDAVAERWGVHLDPPSVWFELHLQEAATRAKRDASNG
jgi:anti-sigma regulatory factor (Ser/Thr protein kinase)